MKSKIKYVFTGIVVTLSLFVLAANSTPAATPFVYEGVLQRNGQAFDGTVQLEFHLFDLPVVGKEVAGPVVVDGAQVLNGRFAAALDFGVNVLDGRPRWMEIRVDGQALPVRELIMAAANAAADEPMVVEADELTPANSVGGMSRAKHDNGSSNPSKHDVAGSMASHSASAVLDADIADDDTLVAEALLGAVDWQVSGSNLFFQGGFVGIGTNTPDYRLTVRHATSGLSVRATNGNGTTFAVNARVNSNNGYAGYFEGGRNYFEGNVGVGTDNPQAKLDVRGGIRIGSNGQFLVPAGDENLRFLRGRISENGFVSNGAGFSSIRLATGLYRVTYNNAFSGTANVVATPFTLSGPLVAVVRTTTSNQFQVQITTPSGIATNNDFQFIVSGPR